MAKVASKAKTAYVCGECGGEHNKWQGQCGECGAWNTLSEIVLEPASAAAAKSPARRDGWAGKVDAPKVTALADVRHHEDSRVSTGIGEFDRVLGGGLVEGAVVLVGGDPGIGKSTLLLQAVAKMAGGASASDGTPLPASMSPARNRWRRWPGARRGWACRSTVSTHSPKPASNASSNTPWRCNRN
jgi:hypothetical protein